MYVTSFSRLLADKQGKLSLREPRVRHVVVYDRWRGRFSQIFDQRGGRIQLNLNKRRSKQCGSRGSAIRRHHGARAALRLNNALEQFDFRGISDEMSLEINNLYYLRDNNGYSRNVPGKWNDTKPQSLPAKRSRRNKCVGSNRADVLLPIENTHTRSSYIIHRK